MGGLGNQLFQIFTAISYAIDNKTSFYFENVEIKCGSRKIKYWDNILSKAAQYLSTNKAELNIKEVGYHFTKLPDVKDKKKNLKLTGYFQSPKYFEHNLKEILDITGVLDKRIFFESLYDYENIISIHFRLGDYKKLQNFHPVVPTDYYYYSLHYIMSFTEKKDWTILYFCEDEDIELVNDKIKVLQNNYKDMKFIKIDSKHTDWEQILIMSLCKHNIIANSTFSWWGAYLNKNEKDAIVCYPTIWFGPQAGKRIMCDLFPEHWEEIFY